MAVVQPTDLTIKPKYLPFEKNRRYSIGIDAVKLFTCDFDHGQLDQQVFQLDYTYRQMRSQKFVPNDETGAGIYLTHELDIQTRDDCTQFLIDNLTREYPEYFKFHKSIFYNNLYLKHSICNPRLLDMCLIVPAEVVIIKVLKGRLDGTNWMAMCHVSDPHGWKPKDLIGKEFSQIHSPVPQMEAINRNSQKICEYMLNAGPFVRFIWSFRFNEESPEESVMITERQTTHPLNTTSWVFLIRNYSYKLNELTYNQIDALIETLLNMSPDVLKYKGYENNLDRIVSFLGSKICASRH